MKPTKQMYELLTYVNKHLNYGYKYNTTVTIPKRSIFKNIEVCVVETYINYIVTTLTSLANTKGGIIIVGLRQSIINSDKLIYYIKLGLEEYNIIPTYKCHKLEFNNKNIIYITVSKLNIVDIPCYQVAFYESLGRMRIKGKNEKMPPSFIRALENIRFNGHKDECVPNRKYNTKYTDQKLLSFFFKKYKTIHKQLPLSNGEIKSFLYYDLRTKTIDFILTFSICPQIYYPDLNLKIFNEITGEIEIIDGSISHIHKYAMIYLKKELGYKLISTKTHIIKIESPYHMGILSELLYNALIHRDYSYYFSAIPIEITIKEETIEISNPGYFLLSIDEINQNHKLTKNQYIKMCNDIIVDKDIPNHGYKYIRRASKLSNSRYEIIDDNTGIFKVVLSQRQPTIYKEPYTIEAILTYCIKPKSKLEIYQHFFSMTKINYKYFYKKYIIRLIRSKILLFTMPEKPESKFQKLIANKDFLDCLK